MRKSRKFSNKKKKKGTVRKMIKTGFRTGESVSMMLLFAALLFGWYKAHEYLINNVIRPNIIVPTAAKIAEQFISDNESKFKSNESVLSYLNKLFVLLGVIVTGLLASKDSSIKGVTFFSIPLIWSIWMSDKFNETKFIGYKSTKPTILYNDMTHQDFLRYSIEFAGIMTSIFGIGSAEYYAIKTIL